MICQNPGDYSGKHHFSIMIYAAIIASFLGMSTSSVCAQGARGVMDDLIRGTARVADDLPLNKVDELVEELKRSRLVRGANRSDEVLKLLRTATNNLDPNVFRRLEQLDDASRDVALVLARGGDDLARTVPDLATRGRLLREGGPETVAAVGLHGPNAARSALRLDEAIKGGTLIVRNGGRAVTLADFGRVMTRYEGNAWKFWEQYVLPHWKVWAAGGALAAYLANPEFFQDAAGQLTEAGFKHLIELVGAVAAAAIKGVAGGTGGATKDIWEAFWEAFVANPEWLYAFIGMLILFSWLAWYFFRRIRYYANLPFRWLNQVPENSEISKTDS